MDPQEDNTQESGQKQHGIYPSNLPQGVDQIDEQPEEEDDNCDDKSNKVIKQNEEMKQEDHENISNEDDLNEES